VVDLSPSRVLSDDTVPAYHLPREVSLVYNVLGRAEEALLGRAWPGMRDAKHEFPPSDGTCPLPAGEPRSRTSMTVSVSQVVASPVMSRQPPSQNRDFVAEILDLQIRY
jgi:hypothetical protein